ncbi:hypothetical protein R5R35_005895 [Gryllus longicercus]|uniref:RING-type domain-containing protein n=1 Tax=Gryllus longicercus TaxID=2509291 RepID=A0AAN9VQX8_9ORTH
MMVAMTAMLVSVAELSNIFSVLAVLICFCAMVLFIMRNMMVFRLHGEEMIFGSSVHQVQHQIPQMKMMKVHIPFTFKLTDASKSSYSDLQCLVSSQVPYTLQAIWGVSIRELHLFLWRPWNVLHSQLQAGNLLQGHYQQKGVIIQKTSHNNEVLTLSLPQPALDLGTPPRLCYPLVIFLVRNDPRTMQPDETVALINVVHIKDSVCTLPTSILAQYLKQANGQLSCLKQLYLATGNPLSYEDEPTASLVCPQEEEERSVWTTAGEQLCVVCQYFPLSRALLPCRHTCICASCFSKLDRCPMCRSPIRSYFCIRGEDYMPSEPCAPATKPPPMLQWLQDLNDRLTDLLGFQR